MITVSFGVTPAHGGTSLGKSGDQESVCDGEKEQVQGLELPWHTAEQAFGRVEEARAGF